MKVVYLIRHSLKYRNYGVFQSDDHLQVRNEKVVLSCQGEELAKKLSMHEELANIDEVWASSYVRSIETAKYICNRNNLSLNISASFDERHYGTFKECMDKDEFWIKQFIDCNLKNEDGESQSDVQYRFHQKLTEILSNSKNKKIAIVAHNACILFYLLKFCKLENAQVKRKLTISYKGRYLIQDGVMTSPSIIKLIFNHGDVSDIIYIPIND